MPAIASSFVLTQIFGWSYMLGTIALSLMFLAGYGGMVSLAQMTIAGFAGYVVAILGVNGMPGGIGWPWWLAVPAALDPLHDCRRDHWRARGAHRGHLHDHDHARDRGGVLLFRQRELRDLQRPHRHQRHSDAGVSGRRLARRRSPPTISSSASRSCAGSRSPMSRARRSGLRFRAFATTRGAWPRSAST